MHIAIPLETLRAVRVLLDVFDNVCIRCCYCGLNSASVIYFIYCFSDVHFALWFYVVLVIQDCYGKV